MISIDWFNCFAPWPPLNAVCKTTCLTLFICCSFAPCIPEREMKDSSHVIILSHLSCSSPWWPRSWPWCWPGPAARCRPRLVACWPAASGRRSSACSYSPCRAARPPASSQPARPASSPPAGRWRPHRETYWGSCGAGSVGEHQNKSTTIALSSPPFIYPEKCF